MKVLILSNLYSPDGRGGAERVAELQAQGLREAGHEVVVLTSGKKFGLHDEITSGIKIYRFFPWNIFWYKNIANYPFVVRMIWHVIDGINLQSLWTVREVIDKEKPNFIISHNIKGLGLQALVALSNERDKWIHVIHDIQLAIASGLMRRGEEKKAERSLFNKVNEWFCRMMFNSPKVVISPSKWLLDFYKNKGFFKGSKCAVLPNPVENGPEIDHKPSERLRMLYIGQIEEHKGINWLVRHIQDLAGDWELKVVGDGSAMADVQRISADEKRIKILGKKNRKEINEIFSDTDLTIVPSLVYENSPAVVYESMEAGVPVLAARIGGCGELISENKNGWTFESANHVKLLERLQDIIKHPKRLSAMEEDCRESVKDDYINQLLELVR